MEPLDPLAPPATALSRWVRLADAVSVVTGCLAAWEVVSGGARGGLLRYVVPETSTASLLYLLAAVVLVRHVAAPRPSLLARLRRRTRQIGESPVWGPVSRAFVATRLLVFVTGVFAVAGIGLAEHPGFQLSSQPLVNLPARFDAGWYGGIAMNGYDWNGRFDRQSNIAFFPALPLLMRPLGDALGARDRDRPREIRLARMLWGGVIISLGAFLLALFYLIKVAQPIVGAERAATAVLLLSCYPFAFVFNAPYTESLFLLATLAAVHHFNLRQWAAAGAWGLLAGLTRPNGFFLAVPLGLLAVEQCMIARREGSVHFWRRGAWPVLAAAMPVAGMLIFTLYLLSVTGEWFAWSRTHQAWGRSFEGVAPFESAWALLRRDGLVGLAQDRPFDALNALGFAFALAMVWPVYRTMGFAWAAYMLVSLLPPVFAGGVLSIGRLTSTLFPMFLALSMLIPSRAAPQWAAAFAMLQGLCAALFFTWRQLF